ncbi:MAG: hypothetical protein E7349_00875 [Clostridiales bacterium]|nr:hypothetical protein [Clostridiales bacterium]
MLQAKDLKILPFPSEVQIFDEYVTAKPYCKNPMGAIGEFIAQEGDFEVEFVEQKDFLAEEYSLKICKEKILIEASNYAGFLYGAITLHMIKNQFNAYLPCLCIKDTPKTSHRGAQVSYAQINVKYRADWLKKHIVELAKLRINYLYLYLEWDFAFPSLPPICGKDMMTPQDAKEIVAFAKGYNVKIIPACNVLGHTSDFLSIQLLNDLKENMDKENSAKVSTAKALCPNNPKANELVFRALDDIIDAFEPEIIHIGGDEVEHIGGDEYCLQEYERLGRTGVLLSYFIKIRDYLSTKGIIMGIWGDMLLTLSGENRYDGKLCDEKYLEKNLEMFNELRHGTLIYDWWYTGESEKSIKFFAEKQFNIVSAASTHGCMTSIPSFDQHLNIRALFKDTLKYKLSGGIITEWINGFGYHAEQTYFNIAAGACMLWSGVDENGFICQCDREKFEKDYLFVRYATNDDALLQYFHLAGDLYGELLSMFPADRKGVSIRKSVFYTDNPLTVYIKNITDLDGKMDEYQALVARLNALYKQAQKACKDDGYFYALKIAAVCHSYILKAVQGFDKFHQCYDKAAKSQYTNQKDFEKHLDACATILQSLKGIYKEPIAFAEWMHEKLGVEESSVYRLKMARKNLSKLIRFVEQLKGNYRPLPSMVRLSEALFHRERDVWWRPRGYEWAEETSEFRTYDVELGFYYEVLNWEHIRNQG